MVVPRNPVEGRRARLPLPAFVLALASLANLSGCGNEATPASSGTAGTTGAGAGATSSGGAGGTECVGVSVPEEAFGRAPGPVAMGGAGGAGGAGGGTGEGGAPPPPTTLGAPRPTYWLDDFQPQSCGYGATYGLDAFEGMVTVVGLWAGW